MNLNVILSIILLVPTSAVSAVEFTVTEKQGLFALHEGGKQLISTYYVFWGKKWKWAHQEARFEFGDNFNYSVEGNNEQLGLKFLSSTRKLDEQQMVWNFELMARKTLHDVIGGGITFKLDLDNELNRLGEPVLLPDNLGWRWGQKKKKGIEITFRPPLEKVYFERGKNSEIRAFFYNGEVPQGKIKHTMTVKLHGDIEIKETVSERFKLKDAINWPKDRIDWQSFPIDLSFLNAYEKPAGKHGFMKTSAEKLVFEDGTEARFWGTNITANALFRTPKLSISKQAKRLSAMGFNLVRFTHIDTHWVNPNIFGKKSARGTGKLSRKAFDKLDWWIKSLKDEGIYIWLDLHVERELHRSENIYAFDEIEKKSRVKGTADLKGYNYVNLSIKDVMKQFNREFVKHVNPYTGLAYKDEPAVVAMLLTNENDITQHFGNNLLSDKGVPKHNQIYMQKAKAFAKKNNLPVNKTWQSWLHGPSKIFLNDLENRFNEEMIADLREIGVKIPLVTTNTWGINSLASLPALTTGDMIDVHTYGEVLELEKNPLVAPNIATWMAAGQVANKPLSVSEWNVSPFPTYDRHSSTILVASKASHQGWDALMQYAYAQNSLNRIGAPSNWHSHNDPSLLSTLPAAALLYRQRHVREASTTYYLATGNTMFYEHISPRTSTAIRTSSEIGKLLVAMPKSKSLPWLNGTTQPENSIILKDYKKSLIEPAATSVTSDTGELYRNWEDGIYTVNTRQSQAVMGWIGDKKIILADTEFHLTNRNATAVVQSIDGREIRRSKNILISFGTNSIPYQDLKGKIKTPFFSEPIRGKILITTQRGMQLSFPDSSGSWSKLPVQETDGQYEIELNRLPLTHWLRLSAP